MRYSVIVPVYNRPDEVKELLESLTEQEFKDFEVIVVEDGSAVPCREVVEGFAGRLNARYFTKPNSGPGQTRNYGAERAAGEKGSLTCLIASRIGSPPHTRGKV